MPDGDAVAIAHAEGSSPAAFILTRVRDGKTAAAVPIPSPYEFPVEGQPNSNLMQELHWYLEHFLEYPFHPETDHAEHVLDALKGWGSKAFNSLFDRRDAGDWLAGSSVLQVRSDNPEILSWPWEALFDPQANFLAHEKRIERRLNHLRDPKPLAKLPHDRINILLVVPRPFESDVRYRSIARPLIELIRSKGLPAHVDLLRPPTFDQLREHLRDRPNYYHVLHFDGHGAYGIASEDDRGVRGASRHRLQGHQGCLIFEDQNANPDAKSANDLSALLREHAVPAVVLNACPSATLDATAERPFSSVATALLQSGMRSVVAMGYSLYVSGAQVFLPAFYRRLFEAGSVAEAVRAGRQQMLADKKRICVRGRFPLEDWLLPVLYQQDPLDFQFAKRAKEQVQEPRLPEELRKQRDPSGFIGRDGPILEMERALHRKTPAILIQGLGGVGKTTLARGFLQWLDDTGGLDGALWFDFSDVRSAEYVINQIGEAFFGENFRLARSKLDLLGEALDKSRVLLVWDNFESTASNLTAEDRTRLAEFLDAIRGRQGKVIITSRSSEEWLGPERRFELSLGGLDGEERWEYCDAILRELGLRVNRDDPELKKLMDQLAGHPLVMRVVLPKLEKMPAARIAEALRTNIAELSLCEQGEQVRLFATLRFLEQGLAEELRPLLRLVALHESFISPNLLEEMAKQVDESWTRDRIDRLLTALGAAGLVRKIGQATYQQHPLLTSYLRSHAYSQKQSGDATERCQRVFVDTMGRLADELAARNLHEQRVPLLLHGAHIQYALELAERLSMDQHHGALTQFLAAYAQNTRNFVEAQRLFEQLARHAAAGGYSDGEASAYHQLGMIAEEQRDFAGARQWYLKSLAISEKIHIEHIAAGTYRQLGRIAQEQQDFAGARDWHLKSLEITEKLGDEPRTAGTYDHLGILAGRAGDLEESGRWLTRAVLTFRRANFPKEEQVSIGNFLVSYRQAAPQDKKKLKAIWAEAGLGPFPEEPASQGAAGRMQKKPLVSTLKTPKKPKKPHVAAAPAKKLSDFSFTMALIEERNAPRLDVPSGLLFDNVHFTLTGQNVLAPAKAHELLFWVHSDKQKPTVLQEASKALNLPMSEISVKSQGPYPLQRGSRLSVRLKIDGLKCHDCHRWITWAGEIGSCIFVVEVPRGASEGTYHGRASIRLNGCEIAKMSFVVLVGQPKFDVTEVPSQTTKHQRAFPSYASEDRAQVLNIILGMEVAAKSLDVFVDVSHLRSGQNWEHELRRVIGEADVFYLFWCRHARNSEWVEKEWHWALQAKGENFIDPIPLVVPGLSVKQMRLR